jgi:DMSO/TMAO reductase YedYZ heme-binding membrane subunit
MKTYLNSIKVAQTTLLAIGIGMLALLPSAMVFYEGYFTSSLTASLYTLAHVSLFLVMIVRPLADLFKGVRFIRPLVILRKGMGVFSASIIVSFIIKKIILDAGAYFGSLATASYWSLTNLALLAHLADMSAVLLLITSNNFSKKLLGPNWKRIQRLSYVYFYGSAFYVGIMLNDTIVLIYALIVTILTGLAFIKNRSAATAPKLNPVTAV